MADTVGGHSRYHISSSFRRKSKANYQQRVSKVSHVVWSTLISNTSPPAWYAGELPDEKLVNSKLGPYMVAAAT